MKMDMGKIAPAFQEHPDYWNSEPEDDGEMSDEDWIKKLQADNAWLRLELEKKDHQIHQLKGYSLLEA